MTMKNIWNRDEVGRRYGRLTVVSRAPDNGEWNRRRWYCQCDCGRSVVVQQMSLREGSTRSCGCLSQDSTSKRTFEHGESNSTKEYRAWVRMKTRCYNQRLECYKNYGGRGITVCPRWIEAYSVFLADVGRAPSPEHTLGRKNNDGNYEPGNVRWETRKEQNNNRRNNRLVTVGDKTRTIGEWASESGVNRHVIRSRLVRGIPPVSAIFDTVRSPGA
jgi:hypothetical protein